MHKGVERPVKSWIVTLDAWSAEGVESRQVRVLAPSKTDAAQLADNPWEIVRDVALESQ